MRVAILVVCLFIAISSKADAQSKLPWWEFSHAKFVRTTGSVMVAVGARATQTATGKIRLRARFLEYYFRKSRRGEQSDRVYPQARSKAVGLFIYWQGKQLGVTSDLYGEYDGETELVPENCWGTLEMGEPSATKLIKLAVQVEGCTPSAVTALQEEVAKLKSETAALRAQFKNHIKRHISQPHKHETLAQKVHKHMERPSEVGHPHDTAHVHPLLHGHAVVEVGQNESISGQSSGRTDYVATYPISPPFLYVNKASASVRILQSHPNDNLYGKVLEITEDAIKVGIYRDNNQFWTAGFTFRWQVSGTQ